MNTKTKVEQTHPWLRFTLDTREIPATTWLLLGEARSKCEHLAGVPLRPETAAKLHRLYLAKGALATTAIEGNTLSEEQALEAVDGTLRLPPSLAYQGVEIANVIRECNAVWAAVRAGAPLALTPEQVCLWNAGVLAELKDLPPEVEPGVLRRHIVGVFTYRAPHAEHCPELLQRLCDWLRDFAPDAEHGLVKPILGAIVAHVYLAWIHPFGDGNGRTARLAEFAILVAAGMPMPAAHILSNHYNRTRPEYYRQLAQASASGGDLVPFISYAIRGLVDGLKEQLDVVRAQQLDVAWRNFVHEQFRAEANRHNRSDKATTPKAPASPWQRQRDLVLALSGRPEGVALDELAYFSPLAARAYAGLTARAINRDLNALVKLELVDVRNGRVRARTERILAFLPTSHVAAPR